LLHGSSKNAPRYQYSIIYANIMKRIIIIISIPVVIFIAYFVFIEVFVCKGLDENSIDINDIPRYISYNKLKSDGFLLWHCGSTIAFFNRDTFNLTVNNKVFRDKIEICFSTESFNYPYLKEWFLRMHPDVDKKFLNFLNLEADSSTIKELRQTDFFTINEKYILIRERNLYYLRNDSAEYNDYSEYHFVEKKYIHDEFWGEYPKLDGLGYEYYLIRFPYSIFGII